MKIEYFEDDGLLYFDAGDWSEKKYKLVSLYDNLFSTGMKEKWDKRVYIDLFCGPGRVLLRGKNKIVNGSPLIALIQPDPFDKYIFCDIKPKNINTLKSRVDKIEIMKEIHYIIGDCNINVQEIINLIQYKKGTFLSFCFVDPFSLANLNFDTIKKLSKLMIDFLILLPSGFDARRNEDLYIKQEGGNLDRFLGTTDWRKKWEKEKINMNFIEFFLKEYINQMSKLDYIKISPKSFIPVHSPNRKNLLYHLAFFSRHKLGYKFWNEVIKYSSGQQFLFDNVLA